MRIRHQIWNYFSIALEDYDVLVKQNVTIYIQSRQIENLNHNIVHHMLC